MYSPAFQRDIGFYVTTRHGLVAQTVTAGGANDGTAITGTAVDRTDSNRQLFLSGAAVVPVSYSLAAGETLQVEVKNEESSASTGPWTEFANKDGSTAFTQTIGSTSSTAAQTGNTTVKSDLDFSSRKAFVRQKVTLTFSAASADDADIGGVMVLGGPDSYPVTP